MILPFPVFQRFDPKRTEEHCQHYVITVLKKGRVRGYMYIVIMTFSALNWKLLTGTLLGIVLIYHGIVIPTGLISSNNDISSLLSTISTTSNIVVIDQPAETFTELRGQTGELSCVGPIRDSVQSDSALSDTVKTLIISSLGQITYERRNKWLSTLNPIVVNKDQLSTIRNVCPVTDKKIAIVLITNAISMNIQEWLTYHLLLGVSTIIIYDTSKMNSIQHKSLVQALQPFIDLSLVIYQWVDFTGDFNAKQVQTYTVAIKQYRNKYHWIGFLDGDEFVVLHETKCLASYLEEYEEFGGVVFEWKLYSSIGVPVHDSTKSIFEQYRYTMVQSDRLVKSFVHPQYVSSYDVHYATYINDTIYSVSSYKQKTTGSYNVPPDPPNQPFTKAELRHFNMGDIQLMNYHVLDRYVILYSLILVYPILLKRY
jgi:Glycosyltransferase family 92